MGVPRQYHKCIAIIMNNLFVVPIILSMGYFVNTRVLLLETKNDGTYGPNKGNDYETGNDYNDDVIVVPEGGQTTTTPTTVPEGGRMTTIPTTGKRCKKECTGGATCLRHKKIYGCFCKKGFYYNGGSCISGSHKIPEWATTTPTTVPEGGRTTTMPTTAIENENEPCKPGRYSFEQCPSTRNVLRCINNKCIKTDKGGRYQPCLPGKSDLEKCPAYEMGKCSPSTPNGWPNGEENYCDFPVN